jgi:hypothetical protein
MVGVKALPQEVVDGSTSRGPTSFINHGSLSNENISANKGGEAKGISFPSDIGGLKLWLDAADSSTITHSSNAVSQWSDKSGNGNTMSATGNPSTGTRGLNGINVVDFDGDDYFESASAYPTGNDFSFIMVAGIDSISTFDHSIFSIRQATGEPSFQACAGNGSSFLIQFKQTSMGTDKTFATSAKHGPSLYEFVFNDSSDLLEVFLDGTALGTTPYTAAPNQGNKLTIFANRDKSKRPNGFVAEMIGFTSALSTADRQKIENYLAVKWGLSISTRLGEDGTVRVVRPQVSSLEFTTGTLTVDTDKGEIAHSDGSFLLGEFTDKTFTTENGTAYPYKVTTFTADKINLGFRCGGEPGG